MLETEFVDENTNTTSLAVTKMVEIGIAVLELRALEAKLDAMGLERIDSFKKTTLISEEKCIILFNMAHDYALGRTVLQDEAKMRLVLMFLVAVGYEPAIEIMMEVL